MWMAENEIFAHTLNMKVDIHSGEGLWVTEQRGDQKLCKVLPFVSLLQGFSKILDMEDRFQGDALFSTPTLMALEKNQTNFKRKRFAVFDVSS